MAQKKISELPLTKSINPDDVFPIVQSGVTKQMSYSDLKTPMVEDVKVAVNNYKENIPETIGTWFDGRKVKRFVATGDKINYSLVNQIIEAYGQYSFYGIKILNDEFKEQNANYILNAKVIIEDEYGNPYTYDLFVNYAWIKDDNYLIFTSDYMGSELPKEFIKCVIVEYVSEV